MRKLLSCCEVWSYNDCDYIVAGETEEDVVRSAAEHVIIKHGRKEKNTERLREKLRGFIYTISY